MTGMNGHRCKQVQKIDPKKTSSRFTTREKGDPHHDFTISTGRTFPVEHRGMYCVGSNSKGNGLYKSLIPNHCGGSSI